MIFGVLLLRHTVWYLWLVNLFLAVDCKESKLCSLNCCHICLQLLFLSDMVTADGRQLDSYTLLLPSGDIDRSHYTCRLWHIHQTARSYGGNETPYFCVVVTTKGFLVFPMLVGGGMWESIKHEDQDLLWWLVETISKGTAIFVTNNSFKRKHAPMVSGAGWPVDWYIAREGRRGPETWLTKLIKYPENKWRLASGL